MSIEHALSDAKDRVTTKGGGSKLNIRGPPGRLAWRVAEFCTAIGISRSHFYAELKKGNIRTIRIGGRRLVPDSERERLLEEEEA